MRRHLLLLALLLVAGCGEQPSDPAREPDIRSSQFDPKTSGSVTGVVEWVGELPNVPPFTVWNLRGNKERGRFLLDNPNAPRIEPTSRGVGNVLVYLRGVSPLKARPWELAPVRVEIGSGIRVQQGETISRVGLVRRGDAVEMCSTEGEFHALRATGAATFTLPFPDAGQPLSRRFERPGVVEFTSGTGQYWWRGYLLVTEHSACARTDAQGRFTIPEVPEGSYELVCWVPNWTVASHDRDPESSRITRLRFRPPLEKAVPLEVRAGVATMHRLELTRDELVR